MIHLASPHQVLVDGPPTKRDPLPAPCVHQLFEAQAQRTPQAVAVVFEGQSLTYGELAARANQVARHLRRLRVGPEVLVGLCLQRSLDLVVGLLGILKAGGAYVPLDPSLPPQRLAFLMGNSACAVVMTDNSLLPRLQQVPSAANASPVWVVLDDIASDGVAADAPAAVAGTAPHQLAYVLYTSGSTGQPKGVAMPHRALVNLLHWQCSSSGMKPGQRTLQFASLGFDVSFQEIFSTWLSGGTLVLVADAIRKDPVALLAAIARWNIHRLFVPFVMLDRLAEVAASQPSLPGELQEVMVAGEQLRIGGNIRRFFARMPGCRLWNQYGPTETHVVTSHELHGPADLWPDLPSIGRPLPNCHLHLLDRHAQPVAVGGVGELYIGGAALARGYLHAPELTAERFLTDPFSHDPQARIYKTGDLARFLPDGNIEFLGRCDHQVKIRGHRIEPGEIEVVLGGHPDISACTVMAKRQGDGDPMLVAFVVGRKSADLTLGSLRQWLEQKLPEPMIPGRFAVIAALPLTPNGKVDRQALERVEGMEVAASSNYVPARNDLELKLIELWQKLFHRHGIGRNDNFFELGGHSLLAARLVVAIEQLVGGQLSIAALFESPTIAALAERLTSEHWLPAWQSLVPLQPQGAKPPLFLVHGWGGDVYAFVELAQLLDPDQPVYGIQAVGLGGKVARHITIESMAAHYVAEIRAFQPEGPYFLGGYSLGGLIAFEVAQQLQHQGQRVALLALLDSEPTGGIPWTIYGKTLLLHLSGRGVFHLRRWWNRPSRERRAYCRGCWDKLRFLLARNCHQPPAVTAAPLPDRQLPEVTGFDDYYHAVAASYRLRRYPGSVDYFVSNDTDTRWLSCWRDLVGGGVSFHRVPSQHNDILAPNNVPMVATTLSRLLNRAQQS